jgi:hypothetical protein
MTTEIERVELNNRIEHRLNGKLHRTDGPAIEWANGTKEWWLNGKRHRIDGPAVEYADGTKLWYLNDKLHRVDGPAIEWVNGNKEWWNNDKKISREEVDKLRCQCLMKSLMINRRSYKYF